MPSKLQIIKEMAAREALSITTNTERFMAFLHTAANNYKYDFKEQLLIHAQKPDATACAEIDTWNKLGRWVNAGTRGGSYLSREREVYMQWWSVALRVEGMLLLDTWLDSSEKPLPTVEEQQQRIYHADSKDGPGFDFPQAAIDYVLMRGSSFSQGKLRIFEQFQKNETKEANIAFLKQEYGTGGYSDAIPGSGIWEDHDAKGIRLHRFSSRDKEENAEFVMKWPMVEKRIRELIAANRYLSPKEKEAYPQYLRDRELRRQRGKLVDEFRSIVNDYNDFWEQVGDKEKKINQYHASLAWSAFSAGERTFNNFKDPVFALPFMREIMQRIIEENTHHADRARAMLEKLSGEITRPFEPTYDELNPPPPVPKEYKQC